ncbi:HAMP domain-containing sensor histidine kinase [Filimonas effusa]|uniref:histidine kinase n=1 Tax=Filimonas effusa TaxID=2508721 RepID=A0A4Q1D2B4_9BACT|nr:HAMP domain-containing sensor histidine kinase [Filimonas effusa]RXK81357.1 HAMP domain-containing histidine kinase [Filimonas effusa]
MKIQTKITWLFTAVTASIILLLSGFVYFFASRKSFEDFYKRLEIRAIVTAKAKLEANSDSNSAYHEIRREHLEKLPSEKEYFFKINKQTGQVDSAAILPVPVSFFKHVIQNGEAVYRRKDLFYLGFLYKQPQGSSVVVISAINDYSREYLGNLKNVLLITFFFSMVVVLTVGIMFSRQILKPVRLITERVKEISSTNLHLRLYSGKGKDEIEELSQTFNNMLDRLETSFESQNNFVSNASHELSTPLTAIIGEAELTLNRPRTQEQYVRSTQIILNEAERLRNITTTLLNLAQTGFNGKKQDWEPLRADELVWSVKKSVDNINPQNQVFFDTSHLPEEVKKLSMLGNMQLLILALSNIVLNACKYSNNQTVTIGVAATDERILIVIRDKGIGIPEPEIPYVFDPFFRASNVQHLKGYGIGLPLSRNIIRMHGGDIVVNSREGEGTIIHISLPIKD